MKITKKINSHSYEIAALTAHENSIQLLNEAKILHDYKKYPRSYALSVLSMEEFSKSFLYKCKSTGLIKDNDFENDIKIHNEKIFHSIHLIATVFFTMGLDHIFEFSKLVDGKQSDHSEHILPTILSLKTHPEKVVKELKDAHKNKMAALYVEIKNDKIIKPDDIVDKKKSWTLICILDLAIHGFVHILKLDKKEFSKMVLMLDPQIFSGTMKSDFTKYKET